MQIIVHFWCYTVRTFLVLYSAYISGVIQCVRKVAGHLGYGTIQLKCDGTQ